MDDMKCFGYYIAKSLPSPEFCTLKTNYILSVSDDGLSEKFPELEKCFWTNYPEISRAQYQKYLQLNDVEFEEFCDLAAELFENKHLSAGVRFCCFEDAKRMYKYLKNANNYKIIGIFTDSKAFDEYEEDGIFEAILPPKECTAQKNKLGCEILGGECLGEGSFFFYNYIINNLNKVIEDHFGEKYIIDYETGLIKNSFDETKAFCDLIQGQGEPVTWTAFEVYEFLEMPYNNA